MLHLESNTFLWHGPLTAKSWTREGNLLSLHNPNKYGIFHPNVSCFLSNFKNRPDKLSYWTPLNFLKVLNFFSFLYFCHKCTMRSDPRKPNVPSWSWFKLIQNCITGLLLMQCKGTAVWRKSAIYSTYKTWIHCTAYAL